MGAAIDQGYAVSPARRMAAALRPEEPYLAGISHTI
jgi:hypothetical protein